MVVAGVGAAGVAAQQDPPGGRAWPRSSASTARAPSGRAATTSTSPSCGSPSTPTPSAARARSSEVHARRRRVHRRVRARASSRRRTSARWRTDPIVFAMANPDPEIRPEDADGLAAVIATGRSDYPNQINNVLAFPGIFRGALDVAATSITEGMKLAAARGHRRGGRRRRAARLHRPVGVRHAGRAARGRARRRGRGRRGRLPHRARLTRPWLGTGRGRPLASPP